MINKIYTNNEKYYKVISIVKNKNTYTRQWNAMVLYEAQDGALYTRDFKEFCDRFKEAPLQDKVVFNFKYNLSQLQQKEQEALQCNKLYTETEMIIILLDMWTDNPFDTNKKEIIRKYVEKGICPLAFHQWVEQRLKK